MPDGRGILLSCKAKIAGTLDVFQDFLTQRAAKDPARRYATPVNTDSYYARLQYGVHEPVLRELSNQFQEDTILLCCDGTAWRKAKSLEPPDNIVLCVLWWAMIRNDGYRSYILMLNGSIHNHKFYKY